MEAKAKAKVAQKSSENKCVRVPQKKTCIQFPFANFAKSSVVFPTRRSSFLNPAHYGENQADGTQKHGWQGAAQAARHQGRAKEDAG